MIAKTFYRKYPELVEKINSIYKVYNDSVEKLKKLEKEGKVLVIRPSKDLHIKRIEKNVDKLQAQYDLGLSDAQKNIKEVKKYLKK